MRKATGACTQQRSVVTTDRRQAGALSKRLANQVNMMAAVAHDLRHPLFRIALATDLAADSDHDGRTLERSVSMIREGLASIARLVEDLDDYGSLQAGRLRVIRSPVDPTEIVGSAIEAFKLLAAPKLIRVSTLVEGPLPMIVVDRDRLFQVLSNLLANAVCMTPAGGEVTVEVEHDGGQMRFSVSDTGPGINPADVPHLFEPYWRGMTGYSGRGLGLAIARALVEGHGGRIWADNNPSGGARFSFTIGE